MAQTEQKPRYRIAAGSQRWSTPEPTKQSAPQEKASTTSPEWMTRIGFGPSSTGINVTPDSSMQAAAVFACIRVLSEDVAKIPIHLKRQRSDGGSDIITDHNLARLLNVPNSWQTSYEFRQMMMAGLGLRGNSIAVLIRNGRGEIQRIIPIRSNGFTVYSAEDGTLFYQIAKLGTHDLAVLRDVPLLVPQEDILHLRWMPLDGIHGVSPITYAREAVGLSLAAEKHGAASFGNAAKPQGVLKHPAQLTRETAEKLREQWREVYQGPANAGKTMVLEEGMTFEPLKLSNEDAQFLESRKFQVEEIARIFRVPPHMIMHLERATFSNIEQQSLDYVTNTLMSWFELWESAMNRDLLRTKERQQGYYFEFDANRILRGNVKDRFASYATARQWGWMSVNDIRKKEGLNPIAGGDNYLQPANMVPVGTSTPDTGALNATQPDPTEEPQPGSNGDNSNE